MAVWVYLTLLNCTFKNGEGGKFCVYFTVSKNKILKRRKNRFQ